MSVLDGNWDNKDHKLDGKKHFQILLNHKLEKADSRLLYVYSIKTETVSEFVTLIKQSTKNMFQETYLLNHD
jgi:hypothetical protein